MRFLNWDVLLFPNESRIPIQEFDVKCHILPASREPSCHPLPSHLANSIQAQTAINNVPTLTGFIPSYQPGSPFRISIHSWEKPSASAILKTLTPRPGRVIFEARVMVDGVLAVQRYFGEHNTWPEVIENTSFDALTTGPKPLLFPAFHPQILQQKLWNPLDPKGRIRLVISEGIAKSQSCLASKDFDKLREVVVFSFQHAPRNILEHSNIAWPTATMVQQLIIGNHGVELSDLHTHVPLMNLSSLTPARTRQSIPYSKTLAASVWAQRQPQMGGNKDDPFLDPVVRAAFTARRKTSSDQSMPDYMSRTPSRGAARGGTESEMSGVSYEKTDFERQLRQAKVEEIIKILSPRKQADILKHLSPSKRVGLDLATDLDNDGILVVSTDATQSVEPLFRAQTKSIDAVQSIGDGSRSTSGSSAAMS